MINEESSNSATPTLFGTINALEISILNGSQFRRLVQKFLTQGKQTTNPIAVMKIYSKSAKTLIGLGFLTLSLAPIASAGTRNGNPPPPPPSQVNADITPKDVVSPKS